MIIRLRVRFWIHVLLSVKYCLVIAASTYKFIVALACCLCRSKLSNYFFPNLIVQVWLVAASMYRPCVILLKAVDLIGKDRMGQDGDYCAVICVAFALFSVTCNIWFLVKYFLQFIFFISIWWLLYYFFNILWFWGF